MCIPLKIKKRFAGKSRLNLQTVVSYLAHSSTLKTTCSSVVHFQRIIRRYIREDMTPGNTSVATAESKLHYTLPE
jgi:hypothetical protein